MRGVGEATAIARPGVRRVARIDFQVHSGGRDNGPLVYVAPVVKLLDQPHAGLRPENVVYAIAGTEAMLEKRAGSGADVSRCSLILMYR